jgi:hypothetical protein
MTLPNDVHILILKIWVYVGLHNRRIKAADEIKISNQVILKEGDYSGFSKWAHYNHKTT